MIYSLQSFRIPTYDRKGSWSFATKPNLLLEVISKALGFLPVHSLVVVRPYRDLGLDL